MQRRGNNRSKKGGRSSSSSRYGMGFKRQDNIDVTVVDYKDAKTLQKFTTERGRIIPARVTGVSAKKQREVTLAIKRARFLAIMPYKAV
jgi:small subunit ribosomal protein S18